MRMSDWSSDVWLFRSMSGVLMQLPPCQFQAADHHGQHVIEVMRDAAGQLSHCLHLLHLAQAFFRMRAFRCFLLQAFVVVFYFQCSLGYGGPQVASAQGFALCHTAGGAPLELGSASCGERV